MGCGISTANLPSYMRGGRNPATKRNGQLGYNDDGDDHNVAIITHSTYSSAVDLLDHEDPCGDQRISVSSPHDEDHPKQDIADEKEHVQKINVLSPRKNLPKLVILKEKEHDINRNENENISERNNRKDDDENEYDGSNIGNSSWIGSPSFRDYCGNSREFGDADEREEIKGLPRDYKIFYYNFEES